MDRRKMLKYLGLGPTFLAGFPARADKARLDVSGVGGNGGGLITVMNPAIPGKLVARVPLAPPLDSLQGKKIYMVNLSWEGPDAANYFYGAMTDWFDKHYPGVKTVVKVTAEGMFGNDPSILKDIIASEADAAIVGVAG
ncbi:MAG TPA: hypothetical protein VJO53_10505 [Candidatus Acidoferrales bacterium]|nr:hypothetical protein [Candidatus Acidoferrales bacterium]